LSIRQRLKAGRVVLRVEVDEVRLVQGLIDAGLLDPIVDDRAAIASALQRLVTAICEGNT
jgi:hypothetical protein